MKMSTIEMNPYLNSILDKHKKAPDHLGFLQWPTAAVILMTRCPCITKSLCQMQSIFFSSTADAPPGVSVVSKDQNFHAKSDFGSLKR